MTRSESNYDDDEENSTDLPRGAARIGVDADGCTHYVHRDLASDELAIYVDRDDSVAGYDITDIPADGYADRVQAWSAYVHGETGAWRVWTYSPQGGIASAAGALGGAD